jgi:hypothetical protein
MPDLTPFLLILGAGLFSLYVLTPIRYRSNHRVSARPVFDPFDPEDPLLPPEVAAHFRRTAGALKHVGFDAVAGVALAGAVPRAKMMRLLLVNRTSKVSALATITYVEVNGNHSKTTFVEFVSRHRDGTAVQTNNLTQLGVFNRPHVTCTQFPSVADPAKLYRLHQLMEDRHASPAGKALRLDEEFGGDAAATMARAMAEEIEWQTDSGYLYHDAQMDAYRPTWKGAFLTVWPMLWPLKAVRLHRRAYKARRLIAELEADRAS